MSLSAMSYDVMTMIFKANREGKNQIVISRCPNPNPVNLNFLSDFFLSINREPQNENK
jgi:hypothetical protein